MPSFPTSVYSPASKTTGQTIQASHVNDLDNEVVAIETGYLNGTARLNSSHSTVAALSVTGGSTLGATLQVAGNSTFAGNVNVVGTLLANGSSGSTSQFLRGDMTWAAAEATPSRTHVFRVSRVAAQAVNNSSFNSINFDTRDIDPDSVLSTSANSSVVTFPSTGVWAIGGNVLWDGVNGGHRRASLLLNSTTLIAQAQASVGSSGTTFNQSVSPMTIYAITSTADTLQLRVYHDQGSPMNVVEATLWGRRVTL